MTTNVSDKTITQKLSQRVERIKPSPTLAVSARAEELQAAGKDIINLSVGEPDFDTPEHIKLAAIKAIEAGHTKYTAVDGIKPLKQAIIQKFSKGNRQTYQLNQILVSSGAKHSLYNLFASLINPGDEVIIPAPFWVSYPDMIKLVDGEPVIVPTDFNQNFKLQPEALQAAITPKTRLLILNSPSNPTGMSYTEQELQALGHVLLQYPHIMIVSDDIYEQNIWSHLPFANLLSACPDLYDRTVLINGVSKTYAMTGWRIGYAAGPANVIAAMKKVQSQTTSNPSSISQYAALAALTGDQDCVKMMTDAYKKRHDYLVNALSKLPGIICHPADGTFYSFPLVKDLIAQKQLPDDVALAEWLLDHAEIAVIPGSAFGAPGHIRISYATSMHQLERAIERLQKVL